MVDTWSRIRQGIDAASELHDEWQGFPVPIADQPLVLHDRHPLRAGYAAIDATMSGVEMNLACGGPSYGDDDYVDEQIVNSWYSWRLNVDVQIWRATSPSWERPKFFALRIPRSPDSSMDRLTLWMSTIGASDAWDLDAEHRAREKLRGHLSERQWRHYDLTGSFIETSERSRLTYVFRRLRPTIALTPRGRRDNDHMRCLAVLCMHPIGHYSRSWGGCLVPSDDVIAHLLFMRADEAGFWRVANQHEARTPEAGL